MGVAELKKITVITEVANEDLILKTLQGLQNTEIIPLENELDQEVLGYFKERKHTSYTHDLEKLLQDLNYYQNYLSNNLVKKPFFKTLTQKRPVYTLQGLEDKFHEYPIEETLKQVKQFENGLLEVNKSLEDLAEDERFLRKWNQLEIKPDLLEENQYFKGQIGSIPIENREDFLAEFVEKKNFYVQEVYLEKNDAGYLLVYPYWDHDDYLRDLKHFQFEALDYPYPNLPNQELQTNLDKQQEYKKLRERLNKELTGSYQLKERIELAIEYIYSLKEREQAKELLVTTDHLMILKGWIETEKLEPAILHLKQVLGDQVAALTEDIPIEDFDSTPTVLDNTFWAKPYEMIVTMFSVPKYGHLDPTPWMAPFYFIFFGMMSADAGYGLLLFLATLFALKKMDLNEGSQQFISFMNFSSISTMIFGLIFGSFFGFSLPIVILDLQEDAILLMGISIVLGIIHLVVALELGAYLSHQKGDHAEAYISSHAWSMILIGGLIAALPLVLNMNPIWTNIGLILIFGNLIGIVIVSLFSNQNKAAGFGLGLYELTNIASYVGDVVSYTRIMALAVSSANIALAFNTIIGFLPPAFRYTIGLLLFIALHAVNIFIAYLGSYVHSMRLQYVEMFGKFYEGGGKLFSPLKALEEYIWIKENE